MSTTDPPTPSGQDRPHDPTKSQGRFVYPKKSQGIAYEVEHVFNVNGKKVRKMPIKMGTSTFWVDVIDSKPEEPKDGLVMVKMNDYTSSIGSADRDPNDPTKSQETACGEEVSARVLDKDGKEVRKIPIKMGTSAIWNTTLDLVEEKPKAPENGDAMPDNTSSAGTVSEFLT